MWGGGRHGESETGENQCAQGSGPQGGHEIAHQTGERQADFRQAPAVAITPLAEGTAASVGRTIGGGHVSRAAERGERAKKFLLAGTSRRAETP